MKRFPAKKVIKRTPVAKVKRISVNGPLILSKKDPRDNVLDFSKTIDESRKRATKDLLPLSTEPGFIEHLTETNLEPTVLYKYQREFMLDRSRYRHVDKSRQIGQSYGFAAEGYAKSQLFDIYTAVMISINQEEANEKIVYAKALHESTPFKYKKKLVVERITALEWESKLPDGRRTRTRMISHPQREPRGKGYNTDVYLDEFAHYQWPEIVYVAAVPIITRGFGQLSAASSPLGKSGLHYEIGHNLDDYPEYSRHKIYWWNNPAFLSEDALVHDLKEINRFAKRLPTDERVDAFGNTAIRQAFRSMLLEFFQQEYELKAIDALSSFFSLELINQCTFDALMGIAKVEDGDEYGENPVYVGAVYPGFPFAYYSTIEEFSHAIARGIISKRLFAGYDVGRKGDSSEIVVLEEIPSLDYLQVVRLIITLENVTYRKQFEAVEKLFSHVPILSMKIDSTGIGDNLSEDLQRKFHSRISDVKFSNANKGDMALNIKLRMEDQTIAYPNDRDLIRQIHSIRRKVTEGIIKYEVDPSERRKHHGDKFWALALGSSAGQLAQMHRVRLVKQSVMAPIGETRIIKVPTRRKFKVVPSVFGKGALNFPKLPSHFNQDLDIPTYQEMV